MDLPEARQRKNLLFDFYEALLTPRQREVFTMHYMEDNSLAEIGSAMNITPQAVADMLKRVNGRLAYYDGLLGLLGKSQNQKTTVAKIKLTLQNLESTPNTSEKDAIITQIHRLLDNLTSTL